jgi:hypothetical protein
LEGIAQEPYQYEAWKTPEGTFAVVGLLQRTEDRALIAMTDVPIFHDSGKAQDTAQRQNELSGVAAG